MDDRDLSKLVNDSPRVLYPLTLTPRWWAACSDRYGAIVDALVETQGISSLVMERGRFTVISFDPAEKVRAMLVERFPDIEWPTVEDMGIPPR